MARFDVVKNRRGTFPPLLLDVQSDFLERLWTRVVVPLHPLKTYGAPIRRLTPVFTISEKPYVMVTPELAGVDTNELGAFVTSLREKRIEILQALDFLLQGS